MDPRELTDSQRRALVYLLDQTGLNLASELTNGYGAFKALAGLAVTTAEHVCTLNDRLRDTAALAAGRFTQLTRAADRLAGVRERRADQLTVNTRPAGQVEALAAQLVAWDAALSVVVAAYRQALAEREEDERCSHGADCALHPGSRGVHNYDRHPTAAQAPAVRP